MANKTKKQEDESRKRLLAAVTLAEEVLVCRLERVLLHEAEIDALLCTVDAAAREEGMSEKARRELLASAGAIRCEDLSRLVGIIGTLYEREREIRGADGGRTGVTAETVRFEEM